MGTEQPASYYDKCMDDKYSPNIPEIYNRIEEILKTKGMEAKDILEIGCGAGILGKQLLDGGFKKYFGIDFSSVAIKTCRKRSPKNKRRFDQQDIYDRSFYSYPWEAIIGTEVLEHVDDIKIIKQIKEKTLCIFSVPIAPDIAHVRTYPNPEYIESRFGKYLTFESIEEFDSEKGKTRTKWLVVGWKRTDRRMR